MRRLATLSRLRRAALWRDSRGSAVVLLAAALMALAGAAAVAVDVGSLFLAKRQLQGVADAAALAAAQGDLDDGGSLSARALIDRSGVPGVSLAAITPGQYARDVAVDTGARFVPGTSAPTATRVTVERTVPLFFGRLLTGKSGLVIRTQATAARVNMAAFTIGTRLVGLSGGVANQLLSSLAGVNLNLSLIETGQLASANVDILRFADALRLRLNMQGSSYADLFGAHIPLAQVVRAMADAAPDGYTATILNGIAGVLPNTTTRLSRLIDLGPIGDATAAGTNAGLLQVDLFSFLRSVLGDAKGGSYDSTLNLTVPGLAGVKLILAGGSSVSSPWLTVTRSKDVVVRTAAIRIYLDVRANVILPGIASLNIPLYIELAAAEARLSDIRCGTPSSDGVTLAVTPSVGSVALAEVDAAAVPNFAIVPTKQVATLVNILGTRINAYANIALGGMAAQSVNFTKADIAAHRTRTVTTNDLTAGLATSLAQNVQVSVTTLGITLNGGPLVSAVVGQLLSLTPVLDTLLNEVTGILGVKVGSADVRVDQIRCGVPALVA
ncbi:pilus assembly protein TadG-related protein [Sphingobium sufflavum]|uniref:pilus assembly protein TadG-related protein n=1 Tax=Sphingobium sufflavum TaxID=1129547 RepID=UPI001F2D022C|nr:pilus assembly protein TadG-related protein [Sphingobium sufflavum]MCE7796679.1 pilus assembly protein TadG-related protein [Sphingobium sufflavum]